MKEIMTEDYVFDECPDTSNGVLSRAEKGVINAYRALVAEGKITCITPDDILSGFELSGYEEDKFFPDPVRAETAELFISRHNQALALLFQDAQANKADPLSPEQAEEMQLAAMSVCPRESAFGQAALMRHLHLK